MTSVNIEINDDLVDGVSITRMAKAFDGGSWKVHLSHRIGSAKDIYNRPLGRYTSGAGVADTIEEAHFKAMAQLSAAVNEQLRLQNEKPPQAPKSLKSDEEELLALLF